MGGLTGGERAAVRLDFACDIKTRMINGRGEERMACRESRNSSNKRKDAGRASSLVVNDGKCDKNWNEAIMGCGRKLGRDYDGSGMSFAASCNVKS